MYNSIIYGYGLTLEVLNRVSLVTNKEYSNNYIFFNNYLNDFIMSKSHSRIHRELIKMMDISTIETEKNWNKVKEILRKNISEIKRLGFERWVGKYLFDEKNNISDDVKLMIYILYNSWYHKINKEILNLNIAQNIIDEVANCIITNITDKGKIFTTNFDNILDEKLNPDHIHGKFVLPLKKARSLILGFTSSSSFEYKFLFGTSGYEKLYRLDSIRELDKDNNYNLDIFYNHDIELGSVLLFGLSFSKAEVIDEETMRKNKNINDFFIMNSVDGHILLKLKLLYEKGLVSNITYAYYSDAGKKYFEELIKDSTIENITNYIHTSEII